QVRVDSLPHDIQERLKNLRTPDKRPISRTVLERSTSVEIAWWRNFLAPVLEHDKGTQERRDAIDSIAGKSVVDWHGIVQPGGIARSTIYARIKRLEDEDNLATLKRQGRADAGKAR